MAYDIHRGKKYKRWQKEVFHRGLFKCCKCGSVEHLTADHVKPVSTHPQLAFDPDNGRILCENCRKIYFLKSVERGEFRKGKWKDRARARWVQENIKEAGKRGIIPIMVINS